jgi:hypothetical protein
MCAHLNHAGPGDERWRGAAFSAGRSMLLPEGLDSPAHIPLLGVAVEFAE